MDNSYAEVRHRLQIARCEGRRFEDVFAAVVDEVLPPIAGRKDRQVKRERDEERAGLLNMAEAWRAAYEGRAFLVERDGQRRDALSSAGGLDSTLVEGERPRVGFGASPVA